jgi:hypothetical protein
MNVPDLPGKTTAGTSGTLGIALMIARGWFAFPRLGLPASPPGQYLLSMRTLDLAATARHRGATGNARV